MTETVFSQLMAVRAEGLYNMFSVNDVQRRAFELGFLNSCCGLKRIRSGM